MAHSVTEHLKDLKILCSLVAAQHLPASSCYVIHLPTTIYEGRNRPFKIRAQRRSVCRLFFPPPHVKRNKIPQLRRKQPSFSPEVVVEETSGQDGSPQREAGDAVPRPVRSLYLDPVRLLELLQHVDAVRGASGLQEEARHPGALPVRGHGRRRAVRQFHVLRREEEVVRHGRRRPAGAQHVRLVRRRAGLLHRLAEGQDVLQGAGRGRRLPGSGQRGRRGLQAEGPQQVPAVHRTGLPGGLPHLHGVLAAAQQGGPAGLPGPHRGRGADPGAAGGAAGRPGAGLPVGLLRASGGAGPGGGAAARRPADRREPGLLAPQPQGGVLEPDEAHRTQRGRLRGGAHPGHRRLAPPTAADGLRRESAAGLQVAPSCGSRDSKGRQTAGRPAVTAASCVSSVRREGSFIVKGLEACRDDAWLSSSSSSQLSGKTICAEIRDEKMFPFFFFEGCQFVWKNVLIAMTFIKIYTSSRVAGIGSQ